MPPMDPPDAPPRTNEFHNGIPYLEYLQQIHQVAEPSSYLEIGVDTGQSLALAHCPTVAIDPAFRIQGSPSHRRSETYLFQMTSDEFFAGYQLDRYLPAGIDLAFLDGMHHFEFLLRDFLNAEKYSHASTVITLHDCYPVNTEMARRETDFDTRVDEETRWWWAGDVWKLLPILRDHRPDLDITVLDCPPTGLVVIRGLDPQSRAIQSSYTEILDKYRDLHLDNFGIDRFRNEFHTVDSRTLFEPEALRDFLTDGLRPATNRPSRSVLLPGTT
ncbi:hypothetical protein [Nocardia sp. CA-290969]|uniref:hypothetical protein n=1 Tax=Nocardia sp. CA-290969 TaxID=3239986 RepID=UPI003D8B304C